MKRNLKICVTKQPRTDGVVSCRTVTVRQKLLSRLFGPSQKMMVLIPGDGVDAVSITEVSEGGAAL